MVFPDLGCLEEIPLVTSNSFTLKTLYILHGGRYILHGGRYIRHGGRDIRHGDRNIWHRGNHFRPRRRHFLARISGFGIVL